VRILSNTVAIYMCIFKTSQIWQITKKKGCPRCCTGEEITGTYATWAKEEGFIENLTRIGDLKFNASLLQCNRFIVIGM